MDAKICERCKKVYIKDEVDKSIAIYEKHWAYGTIPFIDLCPKCLEEFEKFISYKPCAPDKLTKILRRDVVEDLIVDIIRGKYPSISNDANEVIDFLDKHTSFIDSGILPYYLNKTKEK